MSQEGMAVTEELSGRRAGIYPRCFGTRHLMTGFSEGWENGLRGLVLAYNASSRYTWWHESASDAGTRVSVVIFIEVITCKQPSSTGRDRWHGTRAGNDQAHRLSKLLLAS